MAKSTVLTLLLIAFGNSVVLSFAFTFTSSNTGVWFQKQAKTTTTTTTITASNGQQVVLQLSASSSDSGDNEDREERMKKILAEESLNAVNLKASAEQMKTMKPEDIDKMITDMNNMPPAQLNQLKAMGMDVDMMKSTMKMMKENPSMLESMGKLMENMTPQQLVEQSRQAQERMKALNQPVASSSTTTATTTTVPPQNKEDKAKEEEEDDDDAEPVELDNEVLDAMFRVAELMSEPPTGGVTFQAFSTLPPITVLSGEGEDDDLSKQELKDCWLKGSLGATRVDRSGFELVWIEVQDQFYNDIVEEARERCHTKKKRGTDKSSSSSSTPPQPPIVGASISAEQLAAQVKNISEKDVSSMFDQMSNMTPEQEARMKAMGVDPAMMKKSANMMKNNPLLRKAATTMMKNVSPEQLKKASQQAQERIANMSDEEKKRFMDNLK